MRRLLASRDLKRRQRRRDAGADGLDENLQGYDGEYDDEDEELDPMTYRDSWTQTWPVEEAERADRTESGGFPAAQAAGRGSRNASESDAYYGRDEEEEREVQEEQHDNDGPYFEGVGSAGFSTADGSAGRHGGRQQWERVSGRPRPRRRPVRRFEEAREGGGVLRSGGRGARGEAIFGREWNGGGREDRTTTTTWYGEENVDDSTLEVGYRAGRR